LYMNLSSISSKTSDVTKSRVLNIRLNMDSMVAGMRVSLLRIACVHGECTF
jgi:hypothetical protein